MANEFLTLDDFELKGKTVLVRVDINAPLDKSTLEIMDASRMKAVLPTLMELSEKGAKTVILAHQGRLGDWDFIPLESHARALAGLLGKEVKFVPDVCGESAKDAIRKLKSKEILLLDNVRGLKYETDEKTAKEHAETELVTSLSPLADLFVNDAFGAAHRSQCSLVGFTKTLPAAAGRLMEKELTTLDRIFRKPEHPAVFIFGGAKYSDAVKVVSRLFESGTADKVLATGVFGQALHRASGADLGEGNNKFLQKEETPEVKEKAARLWEKYGNKIVLPIDFGVKGPDGKRLELNASELPTEFPIMDIGTRSINLFKEELKKAKTLFVSGPAGAFEDKEFLKGTEGLFTAVAESDAFTVIGGGHTTAAMEELGLIGKISYASTGGGSLEAYLLGKPLPVVEALKESASREKSKKDA